MIFDIIGRKHKVKFTTNEYKAIKVLAELQVNSMKKAENPDEKLKFVIDTLESIHGKVKHI